MTIKNMPTENNAPSSRRTAYCTQRSGLPRDVNYALPGSHPSPANSRPSSNTSSQQTITNSLTSTRTNHYSALTQNRRISTQVTNGRASSNTSSQQAITNSLTTRTNRSVLSQNRRHSTQLSTTSLPRGRGITQSSAPSHSHNTVVRVLRNRRITQNQTPPTISYAIASNNRITRRSNSGALSSPVSSRLRRRRTP